MRRVGVAIQVLLLLLLLTLPAAGAEGTAAPERTEPAAEAGLPEQTPEATAAPVVDVYFDSYNAPITREGFCYLLVSLMAQQQGVSIDSLYSGLTDTQKGQAFDDITEENKYISIAKKYELMEGIGERYFSPLTEITRQESAVILYNYITKFSEDHLALPEEAEPEIEDHVELAQWAAPAVNYVVACGLIPLDSNGNFDPLGTITVEEAILLVSDFRVFVEAPPPGAGGWGSGIPLAALIVAGAALGVILLVGLITLLRRRYKRNAQRRSDEEQRRMDALMHKLGPESGVGTAPAGTGPGQREEEGGTVLLEDSRNVSAPQIRFADIIGNSVNKTFTLDQVITLGRLPENTIPLVDQTVSGHHCRIYYDGVRVILEKTGARNPIRVERGGSVLPLPEDKPMSLLDGDVLHLGMLRIRVNLIYY